MARVLSFFILLFCVPIPLHADLISVMLSGKVTSVNNARGVTEGDTITATYSYDTNQAGVISNPNNFELARFDLSVNSIHLSSYPLGQVRICNDCVPGSAGIVDYMEFVTAAGNQPYRSCIQYHWFVSDYSGTALADEALPAGAPQLADFIANGDNQVVIQSFDRMGTELWSVYGTVSTANSIPEPSTVILLGCGMTGCAAIIRRRRM